MSSSFSQNSHPPNLLYGNGIQSLPGTNRSDAPAFSHQRILETNQHGTSLDMTNLRIHIAVLETRLSHAEFQTQSAQAVTRYVLEQLAPGLRLKYEAPAPAVGQLPNHAPPAAACAHEVADLQDKLRRSEEERCALQLKYVLLKDEYVKFRDQRISTATVADLLGFDEANGLDIVHRNSVGPRRNTEEHKTNHMQAAEAVRGGEVGSGLNTAQMSQQEPTSDSSGNNHSQHHVTPRLVDDLPITRRRYIHIDSLPVRTTTVVKPPANDQTTTGESETETEPEGSGDTISLQAAERAPAPLPARSFTAPLPPRESRGMRSFDSHPRIRQEHVPVPYFDRDRKPVDYTELDY